MKTKYILFAYLTVSIIGIWFLAKLWLPQGYVLAGHDSGLALNISTFFKSRFYAWSDQGFGQDNSPHFGSLVTHGIDYLMSVISGVPYAGNSLLIFFWFSVIFITAFVFAYNLRDDLGDTFPLIFPPLITFNFFIIQSIFILERAKYSVLAACLLILLVLIKFIQKKIGLIKAVLLSLLVLLFFNSGSWLGLPLYGSLAVIFLVLLPIQIFKGIKNKNFRDFYKILFFTVLTGLGFVLMNAYSILPYVSTFLTHDYSRLVSASVIDQNLGWLESLSQAGSFLNLFRLEGVPDWYSTSVAVNSAHPFATEFLHNPYLILVSYLFPVLAFSSFLIVKTKREKFLISIFGLVVLVSMFFMAGSHKPLGFIYEFLYTHIPGFSIFRSPYYKFGSAFFIGVSGMIAFFVSKVSERFGKVKLFFGLFFIFCWLLYYSVIFHPEKLFFWQPNLSTRINVPNYIWDFKNWAKSENLGDGRTLLLPPVNDEWKSDSYNWGYWSLTNLPSVLTGSSFLNNDDLLTSEQGVWVNALYNAIKDGNEEKVYSLSYQLGVNRFLLRGDVISDKSWSAAELPSLYLSKLVDFKKVSIEKQFGEWTVYKINGNDSAMISPVNSLISLSNGSFYLMPEISGQPHFIANDDLINHGLQNFLSEKIESYECVSCALERKALNRSLPSVSILPDSKLYFIKDYRESRVLRLSLDNSQKISSYIGFSLRRASETIEMLRLNSKEKYIVDNLKKMNLYLDNLYRVLSTTSDPNNDFQLLSRVLDGLSPIEGSFQNQVSREDFGNKGEELRIQFQQVLWNIYRIKSFYSPILSDLDVLRGKKIFYVNFDQSGKFLFRIVSKSLPKGLDGNPIFPNNITYEIQGQSYEIKPTINNNLVSFEINIVKPGVGEVILNFANQPNLYKEIGNSIQVFPSGRGSCIKSKIASFNSNSSYRINLKVSDRSQRFKFLIKSDENSPSPSGFLHGDEEIGLDPISFGGNFSYLYVPGHAKDPVIFICSVSENPPKIDGLSIFEIVSPSFTLFDVSNNNRLNVLPKITFSKVNQTKYKVKTTDIKNNYILIFNSTFSPIWKIKKIGDGKYLSENKHFAIDGYANAWIITPEEGTDFTIEYVPQRLFLYGIIVSIISFIAIIISGFFIWRKRIK